MFLFHITHKQYPLHFWVDENNDVAKQRLVSKLILRTQRTACFLRQQNSLKTPYTINCSLLFSGRVYEMWMLSAATLPLSPVFVHTLGYVDVFFFLFYFPVFAVVRCVVSPIKVCAIKFQRYEHREPEGENKTHRWIHRCDS